MRDFEHQLDTLTAHQDAIAFLHSHNVKIYTLRKRNVLIHSKLYLLHRANENLAQSFAIIGSSNLTASGLGLYNDNSNKELNLLCDSKKDTAHALIYFENLRAQCSDVSQEVRENLTSSFFYHAPADVLHKLISLLPKDLEALKSSEEDTLNIAKEIFGLYDFQLIAAKELYKRLKAYNIAFLGDPVGAGKTLSALGVAALYKRVVIITPKNLKTQWQSYLICESSAHNVAHREFVATLPYKIHILSYHEATHPNDEQRQKLLGADLVVLDESHNFRNGAPKGSTKNSKPNRYTLLRDNLNPDSALLALSATIINNSLLDFANQIALKTKDTPISIHSARIKPIEACRQAQNALSEQKPLPQEYGYLTSLIFSRSSEEILSELKKLDKDMPQTSKERRHLSSIPSNIEFSYARLLEILGVGDGSVAQQNPQKSGDRSEGITFSIYDPYPYLPKNVRDIVKEAHLENLGEYTTPKGFICMSLLKSLESSVDAFLATLDKIIAYHKHYLGSIAKAPSTQNSDEEHPIDDENDESDEIDSSLLPARLQNLANLNYLEHLPEKFNDTIASDLDKLCKIQAIFAHYEPTDFAKCAKFQALCAFIDSIPDIRAQKLLIFTESIPTAKAIARALREHYIALEIATISGEDSPKDFIARKRAFSPISQHYTLAANECAIDILVATDVLSEGQNLQDCANLINWDIAFNPVRAIQRIGRIHRIGSSHRTIRIEHFFPDIDIDSYIRLEDRLRYKLQASSHTTHTSDPFSSEQERAKEEHFKKYRQLENNEPNALEDTTATKLFSSPTNLLQSLAYELSSAPSPLPDGIFSIARIDGLEPNTIFAALRSIEKSPKGAKTYYTLYDTRTAPSATDQEGATNLTKILPCARDTHIPAGDFENLERVSDNYRDIDFLRQHFRTLTSELDSQIKSVEKARDSMRKSDSGLIPLESTRFSLIAWILINPDFGNLNPARPARSQILDSQRAQGGGK